MNLEAVIGSLVAASVFDEAAGSRLAKLKNLELEELREAQQIVLAAADAFNPDEPSHKDVVALAACADFAVAVRAELHERLATEDARREAADKLARSIAASAADSDETAARLEGSTGRRRLPSISRLSQRQPGRTRPTATATRGTGRVLTAAAGQVVGDVHQAATEAARSIDRMVGQRGSWGARENVVLVTSRAEYPQERTLGKDEWENERRLDAVTSPAALAASGGVCGPVAVDYSLATIATADRPVKTDLANFGAGRGGLRYVLPHTLAAVTADAPAAIWSESTDANPGANTKPHATFLCQTVQETYVDAVTSIVQFGNFQARYFPEQVAQYMETAEAVHNRLAEATLLAAISNSSTRATASNYEVGAARDFLAEVDRAASGYRYRNRMAPNSPLRLVAPAFLLDMFRADLARNLPGDSGGQAERLAVTVEEIEEWLRVRSINVTWTYDSVTTSTSYTGGAAIQGWTAQGPGQLQPWPLTTLCWLFHEGAWVFLDGGELNLGMVRDSTLNKTNDFQMFSETFEKAVFRGHESMEIAMKLAPTGASVGTVAPTTETVGS